MENINPKKIIGMFVLLCLSLSIVGLAQRIDQPYENQRLQYSPDVVIINTSPSYTVDVSLDANEYPAGAPINTLLQVNQPSYLYLFEIRLNGMVVQIFPNRVNGKESDNYLEVGKELPFPDPASGYVLQAEPETGRILLVATTYPLDTSSLVQYQSNGFAISSRGEADFASALASMLVQRGSSAWSVDLAFYNDRRSLRHIPPTAVDRSLAQRGSIFANVSPSGSQVYVDGRYVGTTPVTYELLAGDYDVQVVREGYVPIDRRVSVVSGSVVDVSGQLALTGASSNDVATVSTSNSYAYPVGENESSYQGYSNNTGYPTSSTGYASTTTAYQTTTGYPNGSYAQGYSSNVTNGVGGNAANYYPAATNGRARVTSTGRLWDTSSLPFGSVRVASPFLGAIVSINNNAVGVIPNSGVLNVRRVPVGENLIRLELSSQEIIEQPVTVAMDQITNVVVDGSGRSMVNAAGYDVTKANPSVQAYGYGAPAYGVGSSSYATSPYETVLNGTVPQAANVHVDSMPQGIGASSGIMGAGRLLNSGGPFGNLGDVMIDSVPRAIQVYVDGKYLGITPMNPVPLEAGTHQLVFRGQGFADTPVTINVAPGETKNVVVTMQ